MPVRFTSLIRTVPPAREPVSVAEAKAQLRVLHSDDDADIGFLVQMAREWAEDYTNRSLIYQSWTAMFARWPDACDRTFVLPRPPLSVVECFRYWNTDGDLVELSEDDDFTVDEITGEIKMMYHLGYPILSRDRVCPIQIVFRAGQGDAPEDVELRIRQAIRLCVASQYGVDRANERARVSFRAPNAAQLLLDPLRVRPI